MTEEIYAIAAAVASPGEREKDLLELLCAAAERELTAALRQGVTAADCREAFLCAAGYLAAAGLLGSRGREAEQFTAGEVSIRTASSGGRGEELRALAEQLMAPYSQGRGTDAFAFRGVPG